MMVETWKNDAQILERSIYGGRILRTVGRLRRSWWGIASNDAKRLVNLKNAEGLRAYVCIASSMLETLIPGSLLLPFRLTLPLRFNSSRPLDTSVRSFQRFHPAHVLLPSVSSHSCGYVLPFVQVPIQYFLWHACFITTRLFRLLLPSFGFNAPPASYSLPFLSIHSFRSLLLPFVSSPSFSYVRPFVSPLSKSHSLLLPFVSPLTVRLLLELLRCISFLSFITTSFHSFQLSPFIRYFLPFVSALTSSSFLHFKSFISLRPSFRITCLKNPIRYFFPVVSPLTVRLSLELFAATCSYSPLRPVAATCRYRYRYRYNIDVDIDTIQI